MCDLTPMNSYIAELRAQGASMSESITFRTPLTPGKPWPSQLTAPVDPMDAVRCYRAQSLLSGPEIGVAPLLPISQAMDVLRWAGIAV